VCVVSTLLIRYVAKPDEAYASRTHHMLDAATDAATDAGGSTSQSQATDH
jgi:hypothetical protein